MTKYSEYVKILKNLYKKLAEYEQMLKNYILESKTAKTTCSFSEN